MSKYPLGRFGTVERERVSLSVHTRAPVPSPDGAYFLYEWKREASRLISISELVESVDKPARQCGERNKYRERWVIRVPNDIRDGDPAVATEWVRRAMLSDAIDRFNVADWIPYDSYGKPVPGFWDGNKPIVGEGLDIQAFNVEWDAWTEEMKTQ